MPVPTTTSTSSPPPSTTSTTIVTGCCGTPTPTKLTFTTGIGSGNCGTAQKTDGSLFTNLACGGLYFGGGSNGVPLPAKVPDMGISVAAVTQCSGDTDLTLVGAAAGTLGSTIRTCTATGCLFGPPLPIPNPSNTPISTCLINSVSQDASGTANCQTGAATLVLPLNSEIYLTGDLLTDAGHPGIQPCPLCEAGICHGGPNDTLGCTAGDSDLGDAYPTSHDCPPPAAADIGGLPIGFNLTTGTAKSTAVMGLGGSVEPRVFCGFCRDVNDTGSFQQPAVKCLENGAPVASCSEPFEACEQKSNGAFGPAGGGVNTITEIGSPSGSMTDHLGHDLTLVSTFCVPPTFAAAVDGSADLPGPGAVSLPGTAQLQ